MRAAVFYEAGLGLTDGLPPPKYDGAAVVAELREQGVAAMLASTGELPDAEIWIIPCDLPELIERAKGANVTTVLSSVFQPFSPWHLGLSEEQLAPLRDPWYEDHERRRRLARALRADAYADSIHALTRAIDWLADAKLAESGLIYLGAVFNGTGTPAIGTTYDLDQGQMVLGRARNAEIEILSGNIARAHLRFVVTSEAVTVTDLGGTLGTCLQKPDGRWVSFDEGESRTLAPGDELIVADGFRYRFVG